LFFSVKELKSLDYTFFKEKGLDLEKSLEKDNLLDIDGFCLFSELNILREIIGLENDKLIEILNYTKELPLFFHLENERERREIRAKNRYFSFQKQKEACENDK